MLHSCAEYLTHTLYRHCPLSEEKRPVFVYGFELSLSTLSSILSIILLSIIETKMSGNTGFFGSNAGIV